MRSTKSPGPAADDRLLTIVDVAAYLGIPVGTVYQWRHKGTGPAGMRVGRHVRYRRRDVEAWLDALAKGELPKPTRRRRMS